jgi:HlyD family secretion protein
LNLRACGLRITVRAASDGTRAAAGRIGVDRILEKRRWIGRRPALAVGGALGLAAAAAATGVIAAIAGGADGRSVRVGAEHLGIATVERGLFQEWIAVTGTIVPVTTQYLAAAAGGRVAEIYREAGSLVVAGDPILKLSNADLELSSMVRETELLQRESELYAARVAMEQSGLQLHKELLELDLAAARALRLVTTREKLLEAGLIARQAVEEVREELASIKRRRALLDAAQGRDSLFRAEQERRFEAALERLRANAVAGRRNLDDLVVCAPVAGQLTALTPQIGQALAPGERLGQIDAQAGFKVRAPVGEYYVTRIVPGLAGTLDLDGQTRALVVEKVYPEITGGRFEVELRFAGQEPPGLRCGQTRPLRLELGEAREALLLACGAFLQDTGGRWVFVLDASGRCARRREVSIGRRNGVSCEVLAGLAAGERVVISPYEPFTGADRLILRR